MGAFMLRHTWPTVVGVVALLMFMQKFLYGYGVTAYQLVFQWGPFGFDYYSVLLGLVLLMALLMAAASLVGKEGGVSQYAVALSGVTSLAFAWYIVFGFAQLHGPGNLFGGCGLLALSTCGVVVAFGIVANAWFERIQSQATTMGAAPVVLACGLGCLVYCAMTPSDGNASLYTLLMEVVSLPVAAGAYIISERVGAHFPPNDREEAMRPDAMARSSEAEPFPLGAQNASRRLYGYGVIVALLFFTVLTISYADYLNENYPAAHYEQPTFYAALLFSILGIIAVLYRSDFNRLGFDRPILCLAFVLGLLACLLYLTVCFFSGSSREFCFQLTCTVRRLIVVVFFLVLVMIMVALRLRPGVVCGAFFVAPFAASRLVMGALFLGIREGFLEPTVDMRLGALFLLGIVLLLLLGALALASQLSLLGKAESSARALKEAEVSNSAAVASRLSAEVARESVLDELARHFSLSTRESEIFGLLSLGYSNARISSQLFIAPNTVGTHVRSIYKKMGIHNKQEAIDLVMEGLAPCESATISHGAPPDAGFTCADKESRTRKQ